MVAAAIIGAGALGAGASLLGSSDQADAQTQAAGTQSDMFNKIVQQEQPFISAGSGATSSLSGMLNPGGYLTQQFNPTQQQLENYPGYQFQLQQGQQAIRNQDTPGMGALSGAALKDLSQFNQGLAASNYQNYFNQFQTQQNNIFDRLSGLASLGQNAAGNLGGPSASLGSGIAGAQAAAGGSIGAGIAGAGNSIGSSLTLAGLLNRSSGNSGTSDGDSEFLMPSG